MLILVAFLTQKKNHLQHLKNEIIVHLSPFHILRQYLKVLKSPTFSSVLLSRKVLLSKKVWLFPKCL